MQDLTYPRGFDRIGKTMIDGRQTPFDRGLEVFPAPDTDFSDLIERRVPPTEAPQPVPGDETDFIARRQRLASELTGQPELVFLTAQVVMILRRRPVPEEVLHLWHRLWEDATEALVLILPARWKVACLQSFADHGRTEDERRTGSEMVLLAAMLKLYEAERLFSGLRPDQPYKPGGRVAAQMPLGLEPYSLLKGDIDRHLLARLWQQAERTGGGAGALAISLLEGLNADPGNVFRRLRLMRAAAKAAKGGAAG